jgi:hypothetical protein
MKEVDKIFHSAILEGYSWGCMCGESYTTQEGAENCRKCRKYLDFTPTEVYFTPIDLGYGE